VPTTEAVGAAAPFLTDVLLTGYYPAFPWLAYLLAGLALGRLDLGRRAVAARITLVGVAVALAAWAVSAVVTARPAVRAALVASSGADGWEELSASARLGMHGVTPTGSWWWLAVAAPHSATPLDLAHTTGTAAAVLGAALLLSRPAPRAWSVVFGAGAMTLTLYSLHVVLLTPALWPGTGPENYLRHAGLALAVGAAFALARRRGPLEAVVRRASRAASAAVAG
jgi:hypothetical protein